MRRTVAVALDEDLGPAGRDVTTQATIAATVVGTAAGKGREFAVILCVAPTRVGSAHAVAKFAFISVTAP